MPQQPESHGTRRGRHTYLLSGAATIAISLVVTGCTTLIPGMSEEAEKEARLRELMTVPDLPDLVRDAAVPHGMRPIQVDGVALAYHLPGTGGPADPSMFRDQLMEELKRDDLPDPNHLLEQNDTALVRVRGVVMPGAQRRDRIDLRILSPPRSRVSDLHGGVLQKARLRHQQVIQSALRRSDVMVLGQGPIMTRADYEASEDEALKIEGNMLSGGVVQVNRKLGLILRPEFEHAKLAAKLASAVNRRFYFFDGTTRRGIAEAVEDDYIELELHPRYRKNVNRLMAVVRAIGLKQKSGESQQRLAELAERLANPATGADAALQLEAIGESAIPTLLEGIESDNPELRFYAAEALAYLDRTEAIAPLEQAAREVAAFRHDSLLALQEMPKLSAVDALERLMTAPSQETRYGAFCAIRRREDTRSTLNGQRLGGLHLYQIATSSKPSVVVSLRERPEIVLFGDIAPLQMTSFIRTPTLILKPESGAMVKISRTAPGEDVKRVSVNATVAEVIRGIAKVDGGYGDIVAVLRIAKDNGYLTDQLAIDPLPQPLRSYHRESEDDDQQQDDAPSEDE